MHVLTQYLGYSVITLETPLGILIRLMRVDTKLVCGVFLGICLWFSLYMFQESVHVFVQVWTNKNANSKHVCVFLKKSNADSKYLCIFLEK